MAICTQCNGQGYLYFGDTNRPRCPGCAGTGESPVVPPLKRYPGSGPTRGPSARGKNRDGGLFGLLAGLLCLFAAFLGFQYSSDVVLSNFELLYVREENMGAALIYAGTTLLAVGIVSRYWGLIPGFAVGLIPLMPTIRATFADDLGGFAQVVSLDAGSFMVAVAAACALFMNAAAAMVGHERAKRKTALPGIRSLARGNGGPLAMAILAVLSLVAFATVQTAIVQFIAVNAH